MDTVISYDEVTALITGPPSLAPRPNFSNIRELRQHFQRALKHLACPQTAILGWSGLVTPRSLYMLLASALRQRDHSGYRKQFDQTATIKIYGNETLLGCGQSGTKYFFFPLAPRTRKSGRLPEQTPHRGTPPSGTPVVLA